MLAGKADYTIMQGDCIERMRAMPSCSVDSIVDDPPSSIVFMNLAWDSNKGGPMKWLRWMAKVNKESLRVLKPGGYLICWSLPRTSYLTGMALHLAGFEIIDSVDHIFGQGFPKSKDASKAIDAHFFRVWCEAESWPKEFLRNANNIWKSKYDNRHRTELMRRLKAMLYVRAGLVRKVVGTYEVSGNAATPLDLKGGTYTVGAENSESEILYRTSGATPQARNFDGYQTALKPAKETWWIARKPFSGSIASNFLKHGTGAMNIDACRVYTNWDESDRPDTWKNSAHGSDNCKLGLLDMQSDGMQLHPRGRWPANVVLTHSPGCKCIGYRETTSPTINRFVDGAKPFGDAVGKDFEIIQGVASNQLVYDCVVGCPVKLMDEQSGNSNSTGPHTIRSNQRSNDVTNFGLSNIDRVVTAPADSGGASRFFNQFEWHAELDDPFVYLSKPSTLEREIGCSTLPKRSAGELTGGREDDCAAQDCPRTGAGRGSSGRHNHHPTLKSIKLMMHFIRLATPGGGVTLSRFGGSGTDTVAAILCGFRSIYIDAEATYCLIAKARVRYWAKRGNPIPEKPKLIQEDDRQRTIFECIAANSPPAESMT